MDFYSRHHAQRSRLNDAMLWVWEFVETAHRSDELPFFVLTDGGRIVGGIGYIDVTLDLGERMIPAAMPVNYFIDPAYKGLPALRLLRAVQNERDILIGSYVSEDALRLLTKSGFKDLSAHVRAYHYPLRFNAFNPRSVAAWMWRRASEWRRRANTLRSGEELEYRESTRLNALHADTFAASSGVVRISKNHAFIHWRYESSPILDPVFVLQSTGARACGLAVLHIDRKRSECVLLDVLWTDHPTGRLPGLIDEVIRTARKHGCRMLITHALSTTLDTVLTQCLFSSRVSDLGMCILARKEPERDILTNPARWHFMLGDTDAY